MKDRFTVKEHSNGFFVLDNEATIHSVPSMALPIYFKYGVRPQKICNMMNEEWKELLYRAAKQKQSWKKKHENT